MTALADSNLNVFKQLPAIDGVMIGHLCTYPYAIGTFGGVKGKWPTIPGFDDCAGCTIEGEV